MLSIRAERVLLATRADSLNVLLLTAGRSFELHDGPTSAALSRVARAPLAAPALSVALYQGTRGLRLVAVDEKGKVMLLDPRAPAAQARVLAQGADRRFAPAYAELDGVELVAFTRTVDEIMHTFVARIAGEEVTVVDVTPQAHGAAAAEFVLGEQAPVLVAIDSHAGVSPLLEIGFDAQGRPLAGIVRTPVSQPYTPPLLRAVRLPGSSDVLVAYTAVGKLAATAVGRVPLRTTAEPSALLPSRGYGQLHVAAAVGPRRAAFAIEAPRSEASDAERSIEVSLLDEQGQGPVLILAGEGHSARYPSLAAGKAEGELWLGYTVGNEPHIAQLRCDW